MTAQEKEKATPLSTPAKTSNTPLKTEDEVVQAIKDRARQRDPKEARWAFDTSVLAKTLPPGRDDFDKRREFEGDRPFLLLVWLNYGDPTFGLEHIFMENGKDWRRRHITERGSLGSGLDRRNQASVRELRAISSLPAGLSGPYAVPYSRILIVGLRNGKTWQVRYYDRYDREKLPKQIQTIARLTGCPYDYIF
ncbi:MAG: hypothetical protein V4671_21985 [Armatimonadota bacterium]